MPSLNSAACLDDIMERWITSYARRNLWRVASWYEIEDLIADGYLVFSQCRNKYGYVTERRHFMSLFKRCYFNHIIDLSNVRSRDPVISPAKDVTTHFSGNAYDLYPTFERLLPSVLPTAELAVLIRQARNPVRAVLELFTTEAGLILVRSKPQGAHEHINRYLCRLLSLDPRTNNLQALTKSFLLGKGIYWLNGGGRVSGNLC